MCRATEKTPSKLKNGGSLTFIGVSKENIKVPQNRYFQGLFSEVLLSRFNGLMEGDGAEAGHSLILRAAVGRLPRSPLSQQL